MIWQDVIFLDVYRSIRGNWNYGIEERGNYLMRILPETTLPQDLKSYYEKHFTDMITCWKQDRENFDGRRWSRDGIHSYDTLMESDWFDKEYYNYYSLIENADGMEV